MNRRRLHTLSVLVENRAGVLSRIAGLFARRGYNIESLAVAPTDDERFSRITVVVDVERTPIEQMVKQLNKLINVVKITELEPGDAIERELCMVTISVDRDRRNEVLELAQIFEARILAVAHTAMIVSLEGEPDKIDDFAELVRPFGIVEMQRTGRIALSKLERSGPRVRQSTKAKAS